MQKQFVSVLLLMLCLSKCSGGNENYERKLVRKILYDYDTSVRPSLNASLPLNITFGLALTQIIDVDERNQILTTNCWLNQMWIDYSLRWNPAEYGGIKVVRIPAPEVWRPDIILYNNADSQYNLAILSTNVIVTSEGNLTWLSTAIFKSSCQINVEFFPFDEQKCEMKFASWTYDGFQLNLVIQTEEGDLSNYVSNGEWSFLLFSVFFPDLILMQQKRHVVYYSCCLEPYPDITYYIVLRRRPLFYVFNLILPCVLISGLALLSFYMPSDSGEKVTLGITTLLSMTVFLMVIGESMPPTSEKLPLIGLYYGVTISLVSFATGLSVVTLNIHHRGMRGTELPRPVRNFIFNILARIVFIRLDFPKREDTEESQDNGVLGVPPRKLAPGDTWRIVYPDMPSPTRPCEAHHSLLDMWKRGESEQNNVYSSQGNLPCDKCSCSCCSENSRFRPIMRVRGIQSDGGSGSSPPPLHKHRLQRHHHHLHTHHMTTRDDSSVHTTKYHIPEMPPFQHPTTTTTTAATATQTEWERRLYSVLQRLVITMERNECRMSDQDRKDTIKLEWQQAALILDRVLLWIFVIATIGATFGILYMSPHTKLFTT